MDEHCSDAPPTSVTHPHTRASIEEALADEQAALDELVAARAQAAPAERDLLDPLIARKRQILTALAALQRQIVASAQGVSPSTDLDSTREDANDG